MHQSAIINNSIRRKKGLTGQILININSIEESIFFEEVDEVLQRSIVQLNHFFN